LLISKRQHNCCTANYTGCAKNHDISETAVNFFVRFTVLTEEDSDHIFCKFHCNILKDWKRNSGTCGPVKTLFVSDTLQ